MSEQRWIKAQEEPGEVAYVWWSVIDTQHEGVRARVLGKALATEFVDALNGAQVSTASTGLDPEVAQRLVDEIEGSAPRTCGHQNYGDGSAWPECPVCIRWSQAQADAMLVRQHLGL